MRKKAIIVIVTLTMATILGTGCAGKEQQESNETSTAQVITPEATQEVTPEATQEVTSEATPSPSLQEELYASNRQANNMTGFLELLSDYKELQTGADEEIQYDLDCPEYQELLSKYNIKDIAGEGSEFERAVRLMDHFAPKLKHESNYDNHIEDNSLALLEYSLDQPDQGINCRAKTKILNEMCLSLGIYARRVWLLPYNSLDGDCHVVSEIYDSVYGKWIMIDMTTDTYFVDKEGTPLSVLEARELSANGDFCTVMVSGYSGTVEDAAKQFRDTNEYFMKNLFYLQVQQYNGFGNRNEEYDAMIVPVGFDAGKRETAYWKNLLSVYTNEKSDQNMIDYAREKVEEIENNPELFRTISPDSLNKSPITK